MTNKEAKEKLYMEWQKFLEDNIDYAGISEAYKVAFKALEQEPCEDTISRKSIKQKLQEHHDFFVNAYGGFSNLPLNDKSRVDEITNCIAMVVNEPSVTPQESQTFKWCTNCKEYDQEKHCCHRWSKVIRDTVEEMKQEPRKGRWEHGRELSRVFIGDTLRGINYEDWHCSNCHCVVEQSIKPKWNFCPNCGADMREVEV